MRRFVGKRAHCLVPKKSTDNEPSLITELLLSERSVNALNEIKAKRHFVKVENLKSSSLCVAESTILEVTYFCVGTEPRRSKFLV